MNDDNSEDARSTQELDEAAQALVDQTRMRGMSIVDGAATLEIEPAHELVVAWVAAARTMLGDAPNYSETRIDFPTAKAEMEVKLAGEYERFVFTLQRAGRLTPHEARKRAESERDEALAELATTREELAEATAREARLGKVTGIVVDDLAAKLAAANRLHDQRDAIERKRMAEARAAQSGTVTPPNLGAIRRNIRAAMPAVSPAVPEDPATRKRAESERDEALAELATTREERDKLLADNERLDAQVEYLTTIRADDLATHRERIAKAHLRQAEVDRELSKARDRIEQWTRDEAHLYRALGLPAEVDYDSLIEHAAGLRARTAQSDTVTPGEWDARGDELVQIRARVAEALKICDRYGAVFPLHHVRAALVGPPAVSPAVSEGPATPTPEKLELDTAIGGTADREYFADLRARIQDRKQS